MGATKGVRLGSLIILCAVLTHPSFCAIRPSFDLDRVSWHATHIVVAITTSTDGTFEVIESLKGGSKFGEKLVILALRPSRNAKPISSYPNTWLDAAFSKTSEIPRQPIGTRLIIFLISKEGSNDLEPADIYGEMKTSVLWFDRSQIYGFIQLMNPGLSVLFQLFPSEREVRDRIGKVEDAQRELNSFITVTDGAQRAEHLKSYANSDILPARLFALDEFGKAGPAAVPTISQMLDDPNFSKEGANLIEALVAAGGENVGAQLNNYLQQDLAYWKNIGPKLDDDTKIQNMNHAPLMGNRNPQTYALIVALEQIHYLPAIQTATNLRDFLRSLPHPDSGLNQMAEECDILIHKLQQTTQSNGNLN